MTTSLGEDAAPFADIPRDVRAFAQGVLGEEAADWLATPIFGYPPHTAPTQWLGEVAFLAGDRAIIGYSAMVPTKRVLAVFPDPIDGPSEDGLFEKGLDDPIPLRPPPPP